MKRELIAAVIVCLAMIGMAVLIIYAGRYWEAAGVQV